MMPTQLILTIPDELMRELERLAAIQNRSVEEVAVAAIQRRLNFPSIRFLPADRVFNPDALAFEAARPQLLQQYKGQFVAFYQGSVIDHDTSRRDLMKRVWPNYPPHSVLFRLVDEDELPVYRVPLAR